MYVKIPGLSIVWKFAIFAVALIGILLELGILGGTISTTTAAANAINATSAALNLRPLIYFTVIADILAMIYFLVDAIWLLNNHRPAHEGKAYGAGFKHALTAGILTAAIISDTALSSLYGGFTATLAAFPLLQVILPLMVLLDWALFEQKGSINSASPIGWLGLPAIYLAGLFIVLQIASALKITIATPYSFLNPYTLTLPQLIGNIFMVAILFAIVGYVIFAIDHAMAGARAKKEQPAAQSGQAAGAQMVDENGQPLQTQGSPAAGRAAVRASHTAGAQNAQVDQATQRMRPRMRP